MQKRITKTELFTLFEKVKELIWNKKVVNVKLYIHKGVYSLTFPDYIHYPSEAILTKGIRSFYEKLTLMKAMLE